ncbi:hypothetical protein [Pseudonocardia nigra]|uniref:hypothetical protein n=1 Tax=Pseudonocardia nigra TaxID=1921578 RepID=UPI001C5F1C70|nr:hypothetical protein [Pseudonocardia nigra]
MVLLVNIEERHIAPPRLVIPVVAWSALLAALSAWWWMRPGTYPFARRGEGSATLLDLVPIAAGPPLLMAAGAVGAAVAVLAASRGATGLVLVVAAAYTVGFGLLAPGLPPLTMIGYLMAVFGPVVLAGTLIAGAWRWRGGPLAVGVIALIAVLAWVTGLADRDVLLQYGTMIAGMGPKLVTPLILTFFLVGGLLWGMLGVAVYRRTHADRPAPAWTRPEAAARWGRVATLVAAACALPYGLHRFTWLTQSPR